MAESGILKKNDKPTDAFVSGNTAGILCSYLDIIKIQQDMPLSSKLVFSPGIAAHENESINLIIRADTLFVSEKAEKEAGFQMWLKKLRNIADNSGAKIVFYAPENTMQYLRPARGRRSAKADYVVSDCWNDLTALTYETKRDDCLWIVMSRRERISYHPAMSKVPGYMEQFFPGHSFVLVYPVQAGDTESRYL